MPGGYGAPAGSDYGGQGDYGTPGDYGHDGGGYSPGGYGDSPGGYGDQGHGGYGSHGQGGYGGHSPGAYDRPAGGFPDNDWYGDNRSGGFADTTIHARPLIPDGYRPGDYDDGTRAVGAAPEPSKPDPRDTARGFPPARPALPAPLAIEAASPAGRLVETRQQRALDDSQYGTAHPGYETAYPGYEGVDDQPGHGTGGYAQQGYDDYDDYADFTPDYEVPAPTTANPVYTEPAPTTGNPMYAEPEPAYDEAGEFGDEARQDATAVIDGYGGNPGSPDSQGSGESASSHGRTRRAASGRAGNGGKAGKARSRRKMAVIGGSALCLVAVLAAVYHFVFQPSSEEASANAPLPSPGSTSSATAACEKQFGQYCHIALRTDDPKPLSISELYPPAFLNEKDHVSFQRIGTRTDKTCSDAVIGQDLGSALNKGSCSQALRASYVSGKGSGEIMGTIGVINLKTTNQAHYAGKLVGSNDFLAPLATSSGVGANLGKSTGVMQASFKGHYLILTWAELASEATPTKADDNKLMQFEDDLTAGTANIALSQRMVTGQPGTGQ